MPIRELLVYIAGMPHVRASASLRMIEAVGMGTGSLKPGARDGIARRLRDAIAKPPASRPTSPAAIAAAAKAAGIGFRRVVVPKA